MNVRSFNHSKIVIKLFGRTEQIMHFLDKIFIVIIFFQQSDLAAKAAEWNQFKRRFQSNMKKTSFHWLSYNQLRSSYENQSIYYCQSEVRVEPTQNRVMFIGIHKINGTGYFSTCMHLVSALFARLATHNLFSTFWIVTIIIHNPPRERERKLRFIFQ